MYYNLCGTGIRSQGSKLNNLRGNAPWSLRVPEFDNSFMELNIVTKTIDLGDGRPVTIETGKLAKQAHGSVVVRQGDTMLLAAAVSNYDASEGVDFSPPDGGLSREVCLYRPLPRWLLQKRSPSKRHRDLGHAPWWTAPCAPLSQAITTRRRRS